MCRNVLHCSALLHRLTSVLVILSSCCIIWWGDGAPLCQYFQNGNHSVWSSNASEGLWELNCSAWNNSTPKAMNLTLDTRGNCEINSGSGLVLDIQWVPLSTSLSIAIVGEESSEGAASNCTVGLVSVTILMSCPLNVSVGPTIVVRGTVVGNVTVIVNTTISLAGAPFIDVMSPPNGTLSIVLLPSSALIVFNVPTAILVPFRGAVFPPPTGGKGVTTVVATSAFISLNVTSAWRSACVFGYHRPSVAPTSLALPLPQLLSFTFVSCSISVTCRSEPCGVVSHPQTLSLLQPFALTARDCGSITIVNGALVIVYFYVQSAVNHAHVSGVDVALVNSTVFMSTGIADLLLITMKGLNCTLSVDHITVVVDRLHAVVIDSTNNNLVGLVFVEAKYYYGALTISQVTMTVANSTATWDAYDGTLLAFRGMNVLDVSNVSLSVLDCHILASNSYWAALYVTSGDGTVVATNVNVTLTESDVVFDGYSLVLLSCYSDATSVAVRNMQLTVATSFVDARSSQLFRGLLLASNQGAISNASSVELRITDSTIQSVAALLLGFISAINMTAESVVLCVADSVINVEGQTYLAVLSTCFSPCTTRGFLLADGVSMFIGGSHVRSTGGGFAAMNLMGAAGGKVDRATFVSNRTLWRFANGSADVSLFASNSQYGSISISNVVVSVSYDSIRVDDCVMSMVMALEAMSALTVENISFVLAGALFDFAVSKQADQIDRYNLAWIYGSTIRAVGVTMRVFSNSCLSGIAGIVIRSSAAAEVRQLSFVLSDGSSMVGVGSGGAPILVYIDATGANGSLAVDGLQLNIQNGSLVSVDSGINMAPSLLMLWSARLAAFSTVGVTVDDHSSVNLTSTPTPSLVIVSFATSDIALNNGSAAAAVALHFYNGSTALMTSSSAVVSLIVRDNRSTFTIDIDIAFVGGSCSLFTTAAGTVGWMQPGWGLSVTGQGSYRVLASLRLVFNTSTITLGGVLSNNSTVWWAPLPAASSSSSSSSPLTNISGAVCNQTVVLECSELHCAGCVLPLRGGTIISAVAVRPLWPAIDFEGSARVTVLKQSCLPLSLSPSATSHTSNTLFASYASESENVPSRSVSLVTSIGTIVTQRPTASASGSSASDTLASRSSSEWRGRMVSSSATLAYRSSSEWGRMVSSATVSPSNGGDSVRVATASTSRDGSSTFSNDEHSTASLATPSLPRSSSMSSEAFTPSSTLPLLPMPAMLLSYTSLSASQGAVFLVSAVVSAAPFASTPLLALSMSSMQVSSQSLVLAARCQAERAEAGGGVAPTVPPIFSDAMDNPLRLHIDSLGTDLAYAAGAVIGDAIVALCFLVLRIGQRVFQSLSALRSGKSSVTAILVLCIPGELYSSIAVIFQPTIAASVALVASAHRSAGTIALSASAMVCVLYLPMVLSYRLVLCRDFFANAVVASSPPMPVKCSKLLSLIHYGFVVLERWEPSKDAAPEYRVVLESHRRVFNSFLPSKTFYFAVRALESILCGVVGGVALGAGGGSLLTACGASRWANIAFVVTSSASFVAVIALRPFSTRYDAAATILLSVLSTCVAALSLAGRVDDAQMMALAQTILGAIASALKLVGQATLKKCGGLTDGPQLREGITSITSPFVMRVRRAISSTVLAPQEPPENSTLQWSFSSFGHCGASFGSDSRERDCFLSLRERPRDDEGKLVTVPKDALRWVVQMICAKTNRVKP